MANNEIQTRFSDYIRKVRDYARSPGVMAGLELDEASTRMRQVALSDLKNPELARCLELMRIAIGKQDGGRINELADEMGALLQDPA